MKAEEEKEKANTEDFRSVSKSDTTEDIFKRGTLSFTATKPLRRNPNLDKLVLTPLNFKQFQWDEVDDPSEGATNAEENAHKHEKLTPINELFETPCTKKIGTEVVSVTKIDRIQSIGINHKVLSNLNQSPRIVNDGKGRNFVEQMPVAIQKRDFLGLSSSKNNYGLNKKDRLHAIRTNQDLKDLNQIQETNKENISKVSKHKKDDSFDFDFSALSLYTPVKQKAKQPINHNFVTPKVDNSKPIQQPVIQYSAKKAVEHIVKQNQRENLSQVQLSLRELTPQTGYKQLIINGVKYIMMNCLGKGGSSEVFDCYNEDKKMHVAIKCVSLSNPQSAAGYINEVKLLKALQKCDRIIKMFDYEILENEGKLYVVLEKGGEDLAAILKHLAKKQTHIPIYMLLFYWLEMLHAVRQIHMNGIIHSDLKPANFLRAEEGLKLIDFGIATSVATDMTSVYKNTQEGTCNYISPEALNNETTAAGSPTNTKAKYKLNFKSDVWSLGCILYQLIYRKTPFEHIKQMFPKLCAIMNPQYEIEYPPAPWIPQRFLITIKKCLQHNVKSRPSVEDLINECEELLQKL